MVDTTLRRCGSIETNKNFIKNEVTAISNTSFANFWVVNVSKDRISEKYKQGVGTGKISLIFTEDGYDYIGAQVGMGMENYSLDINTTAFVSGTVNFK